MQVYEVVEDISYEGQVSSALFRSYITAMCDMMAEHQKDRSQKRYSGFSESSFFFREDDPAPVQFDPYTCLNRYSDFYIRMREIL